MSYKPFSAIALVRDYYDRAAKGSRNAFLQLETLLKALELPECDTLPVKNIVLNDAVAIDDEGNLTVKLPECDTIQVKNIVLNNAVTIDADGNLTIVAQKINNFVGQGSASYLASATLPVNSKLSSIVSNNNLTIIGCWDWRSETGLTCLFAWAGPDGAIIEFGLDHVNSMLYFQSGSNIYRSVPFLFPAYNIPGPAELGVQVYASGKISFIFAGTVSGEQNVALADLTPSEDTTLQIATGAGSLNWLALGANILFGPDTVHTPLPKGRQFGRPWGAYWMFDEDDEPNVPDAIRLTIPYGNPIDLQIADGAVWQII